jgi:nitrate/nitrite transport system ATP-binding protein
MRDPALELIDLTKIYPTANGGTFVVVRKFNLKLERGEFVTLIGHSGCGKSTVLSMIAGLNDITDGNIILESHEITGPGPDRGVVFQAPCLLPWMTAYENVMLGVRRVFPGAKESERHDIVEYYLALVGLGNSLEKLPRELSQGMRQRVGIARAFAISPKLLLLDEPFGMLDSLTRMELQEILLEMLEKTGKTALMVTHDVDESLFLSDRVVMMTNGPEARVGEIMNVPFARPRERAAVLEHPDYYALREQLIGFLEEQEALKHAPREKSPVSEAPAAAVVEAPEAVAQTADATRLATAKSEADSASERSQSVPGPKHAAISAT